MQVPAPFDHDVGHLAFILGEQFCKAAFLLKLPGMNDEI